MTRTMPRFAVVLVTIALVGTALLIRLTQPSDEQQLEPFVSTVHLGERVEGRDLTLEVSDVYLADRVTTADWTGETEGVWLIVDATIGAKLGVASPYATLTAGDTEFASSNRPKDSALGGSLDAGLPQRGSFVFELPSSLLTDDAGTHARIRFATSLGVRLDSAFDLTLNLGELRHERSATIQEPGVVVP